MAFAQKDKYLIRDWIFSRLINTEIMAVDIAIYIFLNFCKNKQTIKFIVSILISKTMITVPFSSFYVLFDWPSRTIHLL